MAENMLLRSIPKVDMLLAHPMLVPYSGTMLTDAVRHELDFWRTQAISGEISTLPEIEELCQRIIARINECLRESLRPVINATGVVLHTNIGRAPLCNAAIEQVCAVAREYNTLEYNLETGARGSRHAHVEQLLCSLTGAEAALAVNNNAAAVLLTLSALTKGKEVVISRGELVEIGGSFRIPEVMEQSSAILREVGTTNKTHLSDYAAAINEHTGALLKVHTSNYRIVGFTESVDAALLVALAHSHNLPVIEDLGSGLMQNPSALSLGDEPFVPDSIAAGVDVVTFSGDKLLGGPQAGIIVGKKHLIETIKRHPLARALRIDKLTLAALEATLRCYTDLETAQREIPILSMLTATEQTLYARAVALNDALFALHIDAEIISDPGQVGGGAVPQKEIPSYAVALSVESPQALESRLRAVELPVIARIQKGKLLLNVLTLRDDQLPKVATSVSKACEV